MTFKEGCPGQTSPIQVKEKTSVTVLIPLFPFSLTVHHAVTASAESFDRCHTSSTHYGPGASRLPLFLRESCLWKIYHTFVPWTTEDILNVAFSAGERSAIKRTSPAEACPKALSAGDNPVMLCFIPDDYQILPSEPRTFLIL